MTAWPISRSPRQQREDGVAEPEPLSAGVDEVALVAIAARLEGAEPAVGGGAAQLRSAQAGDLLSGPVQEGDPPLAVQGHDPARDRLHDRLVERGDGGEVHLPRREPLAGAAELLGQVGGEGGGEEEGEGVDEDGRGGRRATGRGA